MKELTNLEVVQLCFFSKRTDPKALDSVVARATALLRSEPAKGPISADSVRLNVGEIDAPMRCMTIDASGKTCFVATRQVYLPSSTTPVYWQGRVLRQPPPPSPCNAEDATNAAFAAIGTASELSEQLKAIVGEPLNANEDGRTNVLFAMVPGQDVSIQGQFAALVCEQLFGASGPCQLPIPIHVDNDNVGITIWTDGCGSWLIVLFDERPKSRAKASEVRDAVVSGKLDLIEQSRHQASPHRARYAASRRCLTSAVEKMGAALSSFLQRRGHAKQALDQYLALNKHVMDARLDEHVVDVEVQNLQELEGKIGVGWLKDVCSERAERCRVALAEMRSHLRYFEFALAQATALAPQMSEAVKLRTARRYALGFGLFALLSAAVTLIQFLTGWNDGTWEKLINASANMDALSALGIFVLLSMVVASVFGYAAALIFHRLD